MPGKGLRRTPSIHDHKYSRGVVAIIAGSRLYPGAGVLTVGGARLGGAGYVKFLDSNARVTDLVLNAFPDVVPIKTLTNQIANQISSQKVDALVVGPGSTTIRTLPDSIPVVLDSGALSLARSSRGKRSADQIIALRSLIQMVAQNLQQLEAAIFWLGSLAHFLRVGNQRISMKHRR